VLIGLPGEEKRGLLEDLFFLFQELVFPAQTPEFLTFLGGEAGGSAFVDLRLAYPAGECLLPHSDLLSSYPDRTAAHTVQPHRFFPELRWKRYTFCHVDSLLDTAIVSHLRVSTKVGQLQLRSGRGDGS
jgi:hypothetical protein